MNLQSNVSFLSGLQLVGMVKKLSLIEHVTKTNESTTRDIIIDSQFSNQAEHYEFIRGLQRIVNVGPNFLTLGFCAAEIQRAAG